MSAQQQLLDKYGNPENPGYDAQFIMIWNPVASGHIWWKWGSFRVNKDFQPMLDTAFTSLEEQNLQDEIHSFDGCEVHRHVAGSPSISMHSWGAAIDINASTNQQVRKPIDQITSEDRLGKWSPGFVKCFTDAGISFGGNFKKTPDPMHFAMIDG